MKRFFLAAIIIFGCTANAQISNFPPGTFSNKAALDPTTAGGYTGPGDVVSGAAAGWGLRCYTAAYAGNVARVKSPADALTTTVACNGAGALSFSGTAIATTCAVSCTIDILYDQTGGANCSGSCDAVQATEANRPAYIQSCSGSNPCARFSGGAQTLKTASALSTTAQPYTISYVAKRTAATTSFNSVLAFAGSGTAVGFNNSTNTIFTFAGNVITGTAADNAIHSVQAVLNGASSDNYIDGTGNTGNAGTDMTSGAMEISDPAGNPINGDFFETWVYTSAFSAGNKSGMCTNQRQYWLSTTCP